MGNRWERINREFEGDVRRMWFPEMLAVLFLTMLSLISIGYFTGYIIQRSGTYLDQAEFDNSRWFEIVSSDSQVDGRFALCDEPFMLFSHDTMLVATKVEGGNAPCDEYGLNTSLAQGRWEFASPSGATPQAQIWSDAGLVLHRQMPIGVKILFPLFVLAVLLLTYCAIVYGITVVEHW